MVNGDKMITLILALLIGCGADKSDSANDTHNSQSADTAE